MSYIDGLVIAVPSKNKQAFIDHARIVDELFIEWGALRVMECWGDEVPSGKLTDFQRAVQAKEDETVVYSWIEWPHKAARDAAMEKMKAMTDPRLTENPMPFDGMRMIFAGFETVLELAHKVRTCLWFNDNGEAAAEFYTSLIPGSTITKLFRPAPDQPALVIDFTLAGAPYQILNGGPQFPQSEAASIVVTTENQQETDYLWDSLIADGGSEGQCGWLKDRFGVSWQIVPRRLSELLGSPDRNAAVKAQQAMMQMKKIDIAALEVATKN